jgi:signal peptidase I
MFTKRIQNPILRNVVEWALALGFALLVFLFLRSFVFRVADVTGHSMEPTLSHGDYVYLSKVGYWFGNPKMGDIVAFPFKENPSEHYIKRVIGVPGDVIDIVDHQFTVNGKVPELRVTLPPDNAFIYDNTFPLTVDDGHFFVLGDNRSFSRDSRYQVVGLIPKRDIVGKVLFRYWPLSKFGGVR